MIESTIDAAEFAKQSREKVENFTIKIAIEAYIEARTRLEEAKRDNPDLEAMINAVRGNLKSVVNLLFARIGNTERFKNVQYIAYDENNIMTKEGAIVPTTSFPSANESNTLSFDQMQEIAKNSEV